MNVSVACCSQFHCFIDLFEVLEQNVSNTFITGNISLLFTFYTVCFSNKTVLLIKHFFQYISEVDTSDYIQSIKKDTIKNILNKFQIVQDTLSFTKQAS